MAERWLEETAARFWAAAGDLGPFPRDLEAAVLWSLPLAVFKLPRLWVSDLGAWLVRRGIPCRLTGPDRPLHGCLVARGGNGYMLLDGVGPEEEQRFSLAHEVAHFLLDYQQPRKQAANRLGQSVLEVFDGLRQPTPEERVYALLNSVPIGVHTHLMERRPDGLLGCGRILAAESRADRLALELLAPWSEVHRCLAATGRPSGRQEAMALVRKVLTTKFGLPDVVAGMYGEEIVHRWYGGPSFREWLGF